MTILKKPHERLGGCFPHFTDRILEFEHLEIELLFLTFSEVLMFLNSPGVRVVF